MSGFSEMMLEKKLCDLNCSAQSIQQLSLWLIHHRKHYQTIVRVWFRELGKIHRDKKLTFLYLANDVVQNSKKKHPEYAKEFGSVMKKAMEHLSVLTMDEKTVKSIDRLLNIWKERMIFEPRIQTDLNRIWATKSLETKGDIDTATASPTSPSPKRAKKAQTSARRKMIPARVDKARIAFATNDKSTDEDPNPSASSDLLESLLSPTNSPTTSTVNNSADPPEAEELIAALQDLENAASADAEVRDRISKFPSEVSEVSYLNNIQTTDEARKLLQKVQACMRILDDYNERLEQELKDRKRVSKMIVDFLAAQKDLEQIAEGRLDEFRDKLEKVNAVRDELRSHIQSLPDLTKLPDVTTGGLAPLPSAGDLFTVK